MFIVKTFEFFWTIACYNGGLDYLDMLIFCLAQKSPQIRICQLKPFDAVITWRLAHGLTPVSNQSHFISHGVQSIRFSYWGSWWLVRFQNHCFSLFWQRCEITLLSTCQCRLCKARREKYNLDKICWTFLYVIKKPWSESPLIVKLIITRLTIALGAWDLIGICGSRLAPRNTFKNNKFFSMNL